MFRDDRRFGVSGTGHWVGRLLIHYPPHLPIWIVEPLQAWVVDSC